MKKTTYWVIGMFIACFIFSLGTIVYYKYYGQEQTTKAEMVTKAIKDYKYIKVSMNLCRNSDITIEPAKDNAQSQLSYPTNMITMEQRGDTLFLIQKETSKRKGMYNDINIKLTLGKSSNMLVLNAEGILEANLKNLNMKVCQIIGDITETKVENCIIENLVANTGNEVNLLNSKIKLMQAKIDNSTISTAKSSIESIHLTGQSDYNEALKIDSAHSIKHIILDPTPGKYILTMSTFHAEINYK